MLEDPREVRGSLQQGGVDFSINIRLKGSLSDHWSEPGRMSLKIEIRNDQTVLGFKTFSLHKPESRQHPYEPAFEDFIRHNGSLTTVHKYIDLWVNGENWGIWNMEERVSKELLEKQGRKDSIIFKLALDKFSTYSKKISNHYKSPGYRLKDVELHAIAYNTKKIKQDRGLRKKYSFVLENLVLADRDYSYDWESMGRSVAHAYIWGTNHVLLGSNTRYYLNPYTLRLEPITSDQSWPQPVEKFGLVYPYPLPYRNYIESDLFAEHFKKEIGKILENTPMLDQSFHQFSNIFPNDRNPSLSVVGSNLKRAMNHGHKEILHLHKNVLPVHKIIYTGEKDSTKNLSEDIIKDLQYHVHIRHFEDGVIRIRNLLDIPVKIKEIHSDGDHIWEDLPILNGKQEKDIQTKFDGIRDQNIHVVTTINNSVVTHTSDLSLIPMDEAYNPFLNLNDTLPFLTIEGESYRIMPGEWKIQQPIVLAKSLKFQLVLRCYFLPMLI